MVLMVVMDEAVEGMSVIVGLLLRDHLRRARSPRAPDLFEW
jgi:hypothetical protein